MGWRPKLGYPPEAPYVRLMRPAVSVGNAEDNYADSYWDSSEEADEWILKAIDAEVESLDAIKRAAVRMVYLREIGPAVFRLNRISMEEAARLCDLAELEMVPRLRAKGVVLGGV